MTDVATLLDTHATLSEPRQPAWGLGAGADAISRAYDQQVAATVPLLLALPSNSVLRVLDWGCAQGYFALAVADALAKHGRVAEVVGVDPSEANVRFCADLASHGGIKASFVCSPLDTDGMRLNGIAGFDVALVFGVIQSSGVSVDSGVAAWLRAESRVTLGGRLPAAMAFSRQLALPELPGGAVRCLQIESNQLAWVADHWFAFDRVADCARSAAADFCTGQRRVLIGANVWVEAFRGDGPCAECNRAAQAAEVEALHLLPADPERFPAVLGQADDGDVIWLARTAIAGRPLADCLAEDGCNREAVVNGLLAELAHLQALGLHHAKLRCWSCLVDGASVRLIDFGAFVRTGDPLHRLALAAVLLEIAEGNIGRERPFYASVHPLRAYPPGWRSTVRYLLETQQAKFSYAEAQRVFAAALSGRPATAATTAGCVVDPDVQLAVVDEHCRAFRRLRQEGEVLTRTLADAERVHAAELVELEGLRGSVRRLEQQQLADNAPLKLELQRAQGYAESLQSTLERERSDVRIALDAMAAARMVAEEYSESLKRALDESRRDADSLRRQLIWMRHRFRWLKLLWPPDPAAPKESE